MSLRAALTALAKAEGEDDETFKSKLKKLIEEDDAKEAEGDEEEKAEGDEEEKAEGEEEEKAEGEEGETEARKRGTKPSAATARKPGAKTVLAILDLPEAKGRENQARKLAETPGMTAALAKDILAAGPKPSRLAGNVVDPNISADGGKKATESQAAVAVAMRNAGIVKA